MDQQRCVVIKEIPISKWENIGMVEKTECGVGVRSRSTESRLKTILLLHYVFSTLSRLSF